MATTPTTPAPAAPTAHERLSWLGKNSTKLIIALVLIIIATAVVAFSFSLFSSSSANPGNMVTAGVMEQSNSADGEAILTVDKLLPGKSGTGEVTIENVGDSAGVFTLSSSNLEDEPASPPMSEQLTLLVTEGATEVYNGLLSDFDSEALGTWPAGQSHTFTFKVTLASGAGDEFQGATSTVDFTWDATQST